MVLTFYMILQQFQETFEKKTQGIYIKQLTFLTKNKKEHIFKNPLG